MPVLTADVLSHLRPERGGLFVDCTVGLGGHSRALLESGATRVIGLDRDRDALSAARIALAPWADRVELVHADYRALDDGARRARRQPGGRRAGRSGRLVDAIRRAGPRLQLSTRRASRHAHGSQRGRHGRAVDCPRRRARAGGHDLRLRRGAFLAAHRTRHRRRAPGRPDRHDAQTRDDSSSGDPKPRLPADRSGDADVPGHPHLGQPRTRRARSVSRGDGAAAPRRRAARRRSRSIRSRTES